MTILSKMCLLLWVEFICLIGNFIRKVCILEGWDCENKQSSEPVNNPNVWKQEYAIGLFLKSEIIMTSQI